MLKPEQKDNSTFVYKIHYVDSVSPFKSATDVIHLSGEAHLCTAKARLYLKWLFQEAKGFSIYGSFTKNLITD